MQTVDVIFKKPFNAIPTIVCTLKSGSNITTYGDLTAFVDYGSVTKKGFTIKVSNSCATLGAKPCVSWIATVLWNSNAIVFGNTITTGNVNLNGGLFSTKNVVYINSIATNDINSIIGMPNGAYGYGRLITITTSLKYTCVQFYIPHLGECIYIRSMADPKSNIDNASWRTISCPPSRESVKPS